MFEGPLDEFMEAFRGRIGEALGPSDWIEVTQGLIDGFGRLTRDLQDIHMDPAAAAAGPFGGTIAHGFLTLSMLSSMAADIVPRPARATAVINYGFDRVRFVAPVHEGKRIRGHFSLAGIEEKGPGRWQLSYDVRIEIENEEKPALIAQWLSVIA